MTLKEAIAGLNTKTLATLKVLTQKQLEKVIIKLDEGFHDGDDPLVSDAVYDRIRTYLSRTYPTSALVSKIGGSRRDTELPVPMASLNQFAVGSPKIAMFFSKYPEVLVMDKHDGLSLEVVYDAKSILRSGFLRGDAETGTDVTRHLPYLNIPNKALPNLVVRGEISIPLAVFNANMSKEVGGDYKAARNAASGLMQGANRSSHFKHVEFNVFAAIGGPLSKKKPSQQLSALRPYFNVVPYQKYSGIDEPKLQALLDLRLRKSKTEIDGLVIVADVEPDPVTASNPKKSFKYKMNAASDMVIVKCTGVEWNLTKQGKWQPVVLFDPTVVRGGATIQRANGHNAFYIQHGYLKDEKDKTKRIERKIGVGALLKVVRSGSVIPYIVEVVKASRKAAVPEGDYSYDGLNYIGDKEHRDVKLRVLHQFVVALGIKDAGPAVCAKLLDSGIETPVSLMRASVNDLAVIGVAASKTLAANLNQVKTEGVPLQKAMHAVGQMYIDGAALNTWSKIVSATRAVAPKDLIGLLDYDFLEDVGIHKNAAAFKAAIPKMAKTITSLGIAIKAKKKVSRGKLTGEKITFTGTRDTSLIELAESAGAIVQDMRSDTTLVVAKDTGSGSTKLVKAEKAGIRIVDIAQFKKMA